MPDQPIRVLCVDDNPFVGEALRIKLEASGDFDWLGQLFSAECLESEVEMRSPDVVLLDIDMPGKDAFEALRDLAGATFPPRVIMLSGLVRSDLIDLAFESGAWGYLSKSDETESIVTAIRRVHDGELCIGSDVEAVMGH
jgi:two-component system, NarL family, invasion response regulator UvrY